MRMNYKTYPTDYIQELNRKGIRGRKKARAFMEYWNDMECGEHHSERFYADSWEVSRSTAHEWIKEFKYEIDLFLNHWSLKNQQHYNYVKNSTEQNEQTKPSKTSGKETHNKGDFDNSTEQNEQTKPSKVFNIYDDNNYIGGDKYFDDLFFIYRLNTKFAGKKSEAYQAYLTIKDKVSYEQLKRAIMLYLHDPNIDKKYNFKNFLENEVFYSYIPKRVKININGEWKIGTYNDENHTFIADDGFAGVLLPEKLAEKFAQGELEFVR